MRNFIQNKNSTLLQLVILLAAALAVSAPILLYGIPIGNDLPPHYQFATAFFDAVGNGIFYPGWSDSVNHGYGGVGIRFYPPLSYYILIIFRALSGNWHDASCLTIVFLFFTGAAGVYFWAREWFSTRAACTAGIVYILVPYHTNQIYNGFLFAEFAAAAVLPFCFLFAARVCRHGKKSDVLGLIFFYALLVLTHLPTTVNGSLALFVYSLATLEKKSIADRLPKLAFAALAALLASSFYWIRMSTELASYNISQPRHSSGDYGYRANFVWVEFLPLFGIEYSRFDYFLDVMLLMTFFIFLPSLLIHLYVTRERKEARIYNVLFTLALALFMATPLSAKVWEFLPFLQKTQFPFRWLVVVSACAALFVAAGFEPVISYFRGRGRPVALLAAGLLLAGLIFTPTQVMKPARQHPKQELNALVERLKSAETDEGLMPVGASEIAFRETPDRQTSIISSNAAERKISIERGKAETTKIDMFYFPHWKAFTGGKEIEITKTAGGAISLPVLPETTEITLKFVEPRIVKISYLISLLCWAMILIFGSFLWWKKNT